MTCIRDVTVSCCTPWRYSLLQSDWGSLCVSSVVHYNLNYRPEGQSDYCSRVGISLTRVGGIFSAVFKGKDKAVP